MFRISLFLFWLTRYGHELLGIFLHYVRNLPGNSRPPFACAFLTSVTQLGPLLEPVNYDTGACYL